MEILVIETPALGDRSYLVHDGTVGLAVDPQRDIDRVEALAERAGVRITHVAESHLHNDYVSGGLALAKQSGAGYLVNAAEDVGFGRDGVAGGDELTVGELRVRVVATPGHTRHHLAYVVSHGHDSAVFSGGSLLFGSVGRTDLVDPAMTGELTRAQYRSVRALAAEAGGLASLHPTHGFGSFCSSGPASGGQSSTIAEQCRVNHALTDADEQHFVDELISGLSAYPSYYAHMAPLNRAGAAAAELTSPRSADPVELRALIDGGQPVVDLRSRVAFADAHLLGTLNIPYGTSFTTYLGWTLPWGRPLTLLGTRAQVEAGILDLSRIGIDAPDGMVDEDVVNLTAEQPIGQYPRVGWPELVGAMRAGELDVLLDVRRVDEYESSHLAGALNIPLHTLLDRLGEVPAGRVWVHCATGYRAAIAASILERAGRAVVHVDVDYDAATDAGARVER